jgi:hypothetical protein
MGRGCLSVPANRNASRKSRQPTGRPGRRSFADDHNDIESSLLQSQSDRGADEPTTDYDVASGRGDPGGAHRDSLVWSLVWSCSYKF